MSDRSAWASESGPLRVKLHHDSVLYEPPQGWQITGVQRFDSHTNVLVEREDDE